MGVVGLVFKIRTNIGRLRETCKCGGFSSNMFINSSFVISKLEIEALGIGLGLNDEGPTYN